MLRKQSRRNEQSPVIDSKSRWLEEGQDSSSTTTCPPPTPCVCPGESNKTATPLQLKFLVPELGYANFATMLSEVAEDYERVTERPVNIQLTGLSLTDLHREILADVRTKAAQFDGYVINPALLGEMASNDGLHDLTATVRNYKRNPNQWLDILPFYREILSTYDGKVLLTPMDGDVFSMFYRQDLLTEHNIPVPRTWEEYLDAAKYFHGLEVEVVDSSTNQTKTQTMAGSCFGRIAQCGGAYWAQLILATMTQVNGPATGSLFDTKDFKPLLGEAMEETLRILEQQASYGAPDEFDGCTNINFLAMNEGRCALTVSWGNSFTEHTAEGSVVVGKLGVAKTPGSHRVLDRDTGRLVACSPEICPNSIRHKDKKGNDIWVNQAPYAAYGGFSAGISNNVNLEHQEAAADFILFASDTGRAVRYVVPDRTQPVVPTGQDPWRFSLLDEDLWVARGYPRSAAVEYLDAIRQQLSSKNVIADPRFPKASAILDALDLETFKYLNSTVRNNLFAEMDRSTERIAASKRIGSAWTSTIEEYDSDPSTNTPLLEIYQRIRGVYREKDGSNTFSTNDQNSATISTGAIAGIVAGSCAVVAILAVFGSMWIIRRERRKRNEDSWYIPPDSITDTEEILGQGSFGVVTKGYFRGSVVALKHPYIPSEASAEGYKQASDKEWIMDTLTADYSSVVPSSGHSKKTAHPLQKELMTLVQLRHPSIVETLGATIKDEKMIIVLQYMRNNTVRSILKDPNGVAGTAIYSVEVQWALQVARGLAFLHSWPPPKGPMLHNDLKSTNVLVDEAFNAHISDFGLASTTMKGLWGWIQSNKQRKPKGSLLWMAPEVLNGASPTTASDVYSFGVFLCELMTRKRPFNVRPVACAPPSDSSDPQGDDGESDSGDDLDDYGRRNDENKAKHEERVLENGEKQQHLVANLPGDPPRAGRRVSFSSRMEPDQSVHEENGTQRNAAPRRLSMVSALSSNQSSQNFTASAPTAGGVDMVGKVQGKKYSREEILEKVKDLSLDPPFRPDLPDDAPHFLRDICIEAWHKNPKRRPTMEEIEERLSSAVSNESFTQQLVRRGSMYDSIIPPSVQDKLSRGETVPPVPYEDTTVIFSDIVGFTSLSSALSAEEVGDMIVRMLSRFDVLCRTYNVKKLDIIGDAFLGVVGVPEKVSGHAMLAAGFALDAIEAAKNTIICSRKPEMGYVKVRFGLASGPVVATVIGGAEHPKYTLFGDTVNMASRMESSGEPNRCQCTKATAERIREGSSDIIQSDITVEERGTIDVKGKGKMETFWIR